MYEANNETEDFMKLFIYTLSDPRTDKVMYVGLSGNPEKRYIAHMHKSSLRNRYSKRVRWLKQLLSLELKPVLHTVEEVTEDNANAQEIYWMKHHKEINPDLTNIDLKNECNNMTPTHILKMNQPRPRVKLSTAGDLMRIYGCSKQLAKFVIACDKAGQRIGEIKND